MAGDLPFDIVDQVLYEWLQVLDVVNMEIASCTRFERVTTSTVNPQFSARVGELNGDGNFRSYLKFIKSRNIAIEYLCVTENGLNELVLNEFNIPSQIS